MLFFNDALELIPGISVSKQVPEFPMGNNSWVTMVPQQFPYSGAPQICCFSDAEGPGYVIIYVDNQGIGKKVWFDNITVEHYTSEIVDENHYYPFGLTLQTNERPNVTANKHKYQGIELEGSFGLETYETDFRGLDPQIGRWRQIDPYADDFSYQSPYVSMDNNPANNTDPDGSFSRFGAWWRNAVWGGDGISKNKQGEWGVEYNYVNTSGAATSSFVTQGSKPVTLDEARERVLQDWQDYDNAINRYHSVYLAEDGQYQRSLDNQLYDAPLSIGTRGKMFLNMYGLAGMSTSPVNVATKAANGGTTVIGEGMARVEAAASKIPGAKILNDMPTFSGKPWEVTSQMMQYNRKWILNEMRSGRTIFRYRQRFE